VSAITSFTAMTKCYSKSSF